MSDVVWAALISATTTLLATGIPFLVSSKKKKGKEKSSTIHGAQFKKWERDESGIIILDAKEDLFFCSATLSWLQAYDRKLLKAAKKRGMAIRLLATNISNREIYSNFTNTHGREPSTPTLGHLESFRGKPNIKIQEINRALPMFIAAKDIDTEEGFIQVAFPGYGNKDEDCDTCVELYASNPNDEELYAHYKEQIERLWGRESDNI